MGTTMYPRGQLEEFAQQEQPCLRKLSSCHVAVQPHPLHTHTVTRLCTIGSRRVSCQDVSSISRSIIKNLLNLSHAVVYHVLIFKDF